MGEIKLLNHLYRNIYLYIILFFVYTDLGGFYLGLKGMLLGLASFLIGYSPVYFLNDYADRKEDKHAFNLYNLVKDKRIFWVFAGIFAAIGVWSAAIAGAQAVAFLLLAYLFNYFYSIRKYRNMPNRRESVMFLIYLAKWYLISAFLGAGFSDAPHAVFIMGASAAALSLAQFKAHLKREKKVEYRFGALYLASWAVVLFMYPGLKWAFIPLFPMSVLLGWMHASRRVDIGKWQAYYFMYAIVALANL